MDELNNRYVRAYLLGKSDGYSAGYAKGYEHGLANASPGADAELEERLEADLARALRDVRPTPDAEDR